MLGELESEQPGLGPKADGRRKVLQPSSLGRLGKQHGAWIRGFACCRQLLRWEIDACAGRQEFGCHPLNLLPRCSRIPGCGKLVRGLWCHRTCDRGARPVCQQAEGTWWWLRAGPWDPTWHLSGARAVSGGRGARRCPGRARGPFPGPGVLGSAPPRRAGRQAALFSLSLWVPRVGR